MGGSALGALGWITPRTDLIPVRIAYGILDGAVVGGLIGLGQYWVLMKTVPLAGWWIVANSLGWAIALAVGWTFGGIFRLSSGLFIGEVIGLAIAWLIVGAITGLALILLLRYAFYLSLLQRRKKSEIKA